jgi:hypothetical protein
MVNILKSAYFYVPIGIQGSKRIGPPETLGVDDLAFPVKRIEDYGKECHNQKQYYGQTDPYSPYED